MVPGDVWFPVTCGGGVCAGDARRLDLGCTEAFQDVVVPARLVHVFRDEAGVGWGPPGGGGCGMRWAAVNPPRVTTKEGRLHAVPTTPARNVFDEVFMWDAHLAAQGVKPKFALTSCCQVQGVLNVLMPVPPVNDTTWSGAELLIVTATEPS